ncbi:hypothetical protein C8J57DRAFT_1227810 [Mycena rebaudengoi]|nr:hypothetical protein C8J57DRAFT_1227810 [Mycena rebaudengoi]
MAMTSQGSQKVVSAAETNVSEEELGTQNGEGWRQCILVREVIFFQPEVATAVKPRVNLQQHVLGGVELVLANLSRRRFHKQRLVTESRLIENNTAEGKVYEFISWQNSQHSLRNLSEKRISELTIRRWPIKKLSRQREKQPIIKDHRSINGFCSGSKHNIGKMTWTADCDNDMFDPTANLGSRSVPYNIFWRNDIELTSRQKWVRCPVYPEKEASSKPVHTNPVLFNLDSMRRAGLRLKSVISIESSTIEFHEVPDRLSKVNVQLAPPEYPLWPTADAGSTNFFFFFTAQRAPDTASINLHGAKYICKPRARGISIGKYHFRTCPRQDSRINFLFARVSLPICRLAQPTWRLNVQGTPEAWLLHATVAC